MGTKTKAKTSKANANGKPSSAEDVLTLAEAAKLLRVSEDGLKADADAGLLPGRSVAGEWRFVKLALLEWLSSAVPARSPSSGGSDWKHEPIIQKAMPQGGMSWILDFPPIDETPEEQEAFLEQLRLIRKSWGTVGGDAAEETP